MKPDGMNADAVRSPPAMLINLNGIGPEIAAVLWSEGLYRSFANRKQVAAYVGLAPTPWQSGSVARAKGFQSGQSKGFVRRNAHGVWPC
jgi:transposase